MADFVYRLRTEEKYATKTVQRSENEQYMNVQKIVRLNSELQDIPLPRMEGPPLLLDPRTAEHEETCKTIIILKQMGKMMEAMATGGVPAGEVVQTLGPGLEAAVRKLGTNHKAIQLSREILRLASEPVRKPWWRRLFRK